MLISSNHLLVFNMFETSYQFILLLFLLCIFLMWSHATEKYPCQNQQLFAKTRFTYTGRSCFCTVFHHNRLWFGLGFSGELGVEQPIEKEKIYRSNQTSQQPTDTHIFSVHLLPSLTVTFCFSHFQNLVE